MTTYTPRTDNKTGADCTGLDGEQNRTLTLDNTGATNAGLMVFVDDVYIAESAVSGYTFASDIITFIIGITDASPIRVVYWTTDVTTVPTSTYTSTLEVVRKTGIGVEVFDETVGTGNSVLNSYDLDNGNVIAGSYSLKYASSGSNQMNSLTETTHYVISKDEGRILLTSAGVTALSTNILYASYIYSPKMSDTIINSYLAAADKETERKTGNYWGTVKTTTEYFSGRKSFTYPTTDEPFAEDWDEPDYVMLKYRGIVAITTAKFVTRGGSVLTYEVMNSYDTDLDPDIGKLVFLNHRIPNGTRNVEIVYTHGYTSVDAQIGELASYFAGLRVYANISGGSYDDATGYTLGRHQVQIGEVYVNVREVVRQFETRIEQVLDDVGRKMTVV